MVLVSLTVCITDVTLFHLPKCVITFCPTTISCIGINPFSVNTNVSLTKQGKPPTSKSKSGNSVVLILVMSP